MADLFALGRQALHEVGVSRVFGGQDCTFSDPARYYSFRRDGVTGRHAALVWIDPRMTFLMMRIKSAETAFDP